MQFFLERSKGKKRVTIFLLLGLLIFSSGLFAKNVYAEGQTQARLAGLTRYQTAVAIAKDGWAQTDYTVLAYGENYPDALAAAPLAKKYDAPILLTGNKSLDTDTKQTLKDLGVKHVFIVGGSAVVSDAVKAEIEGMGIDVKRLAGNDRYATAVEIAKQLGDVSTVVVANGEDYADALSVGSIAGKLGMPIILTPKEFVPDTVKDYFATHNITKTYVISGYGGLGDFVIYKLPHVEQIYGTDKYDRNIAVLNTFKDSIDSKTICAATGENFADALTGTAYAAKSGLPIVLLPKSFNPRTLYYFTAQNPNKVVAFGGEAVVPSALLASYTGGSSFTPVGGSDNSSSVVNNPYNITPRFFYNWKEVTFNSYQPSYQGEWASYYPIKEVAEAFGGSYTQTGSSGTLVANGTSYSFDLGTSADGNIKISATSNVGLSKVGGKLYITVGAIKDLYYPNSSGGGTYNSTDRQQKVVYDNKAGVLYAYDKDRTAHDGTSTVVKAMYDKVPADFFVQNAYTNVDKPSATEMQALKVKATEITSGLSSDYDKAKAIGHWVADNVYYDWDETVDPALYNKNYSNAYNTLVNKVGQCTEYAQLTGELLRSLGYAVRYPNNPNHMWVEVYVNNKWVDIDSTFNSRNTYSNGQFKKGITRDTYFDCDIEAVQEYASNMNY